MNDTISEAERTQLMEWLQLPKNQKIFKDFVKINYKLQKNYSVIDGERVFEELSRKIDPATSVTSNNFTIKKLFPVWLKYAAVFVGIMLLGIGVFLILPKDDAFSNSSAITLQLEDGSIKLIDENGDSYITDAAGNKVLEKKSGQLIYSSSNPAGTLAYNTLSVPDGKTFKLILSDGSSVVLNAGSQLKYPVNFLADKDRTVFLTGEAYFEIAKDVDHPFYVNTDDMTVKVLGTHFNVNSYAETHKTYAVLVEGKVLALNNLSEQDQKLLKPGEKVFFDGSELKVEAVNVEKYIAWVQGKLIFEDDSFDQIKNKLERKFGIKIKNDYPELNNLNITATFTKENLVEILKTFQSYKDFDYSIKEGTVIISRPKN